MAEGKVPDSQESLLSLNFSISSSESVVGVTMSKCFIWNVKQPHGQPIEIQVEKSVVITCAIVEDHYLITGDSRGLVSIRQLADGKLIHDLNIIKAKDSSKWLTGKLEYLKMKIRI